MADYIYMMESRLTPDQQKAVTLVQDTARSHGMNVYLAGGAMRDILTGFNIRDLDFVVQGNVLKLQKELERGGAVVEGVNEDLRVLFVRFAGNVRGEVASARDEKYTKPGKPSEIHFATINEDLRRRDFTVNAMALSLNPGSRGLLLDPFNGVADSEAKVVRILHNYAFLEEPSRLLRAMRFTCRFHWALEERTQARYDAAKENGYIENVSQQALGHELEQLAHEDDPVAVLKAYEKEGWLKVLNANWSMAKIDVDCLNSAKATRQQLQDLGYNVDLGAVNLYFLTRKLAEKEIASIQRQVPRRGLVETWKRLEDDAKDLARHLTGKEAASNSQSWELLQRSRTDLIVFLDVTTRQQAVEQKIKSFLTKWRQVREKLPFPEMAEMRITPDIPDYGKVMDQAFLMLLDGKLRNQTEIRKFLEPFSPPEPVAPPPPARRGRGPKKQDDGGKGKPAPEAAQVDAVAREIQKSLEEQPMAKGKAGKKSAGTAGVAANVAKTVGSALGKAVAAVSSVIPVAKGNGAKASAKAPAKAAKPAPAPKKAEKKPAKKAAPAPAAKAKKSVPAKKAGGAAKKKAAPAKKKAAGKR